MFLNQETNKYRPWTKTLCAFLSIIIALGTFITFIGAYSPLSEWLGIKSLLSAYAAEIVDTHGAVAVAEEEMLANDHSINLINRDGSNTVYLFSEPISFTDENGNLRTKDISVEKQKDNELKSEGYEYTNGSNDYRINFSKDYHTGIKVEFNGGSYSIIPQSNTAVEGEETVAEYLDDTFEVFQYENIYGSGTNLRFYPQLNGVKDEIVLNQNINQNTFSFTVNTENCTAQLNEDGTVSLQNEVGESVQTFSAPYAYDSVYVDGDFDNHRTDCEYTLEANGDNSYTLTVTVPDEWLNSNNTVYPVVIDPTTINVDTNRDAGIYSSYPNNCYGSEQTACIGKSHQYGNGRVYMHFLWPSEIQNYASINYAYIWLRETTGRTTDMYVQPYIVQSGWSESTITWNNRPYMDSTSDMPWKNINSQSTDWPSSPYWYKMYITSAVQKWANLERGKCGIGLYSTEEEQNTYNWRAFATIQHATSSYRPYTVINYTNDTTAPTYTSVTKSPNTIWSNQDVTITVNGAADSQSGLVDNAYSFSTDPNVANYQASNSYVVTSSCHVYVHVKDKAGNFVYCGCTRVDIDRVAPTISAVSSVDNNNGTATVTVTASDADSGIAGYSFDGGSTWQTDNYKVFTANEELLIYAKDNAGNISQCESLNLEFIDETPPTIPTVSGYNDEWTNSDVTLTASSTDSQSGIAAYSFSTVLGSYNWQTSDQKTFTDGGTVYIYAKDNAGNISEPNTVLLKIDKNAPTGAVVSGNPANWQNTDVTLTVNNLIDDLSGLNVSAYSFSTIQNEYNWSESNSAVFTANQTVYVYVRDAANNVLLIDTVEINKIDKAVPLISGVSREDIHGETKLTVTATDALSGVSLYSFDSGLTWSSSNECTFATGSKNYVDIKVKDLAGNIKSYYYELISPEIYSDNGKLIIYSPNPDFSNQTIYYKYGNSFSGKWTEYTGPFVPDANKTTISIAYKSMSFSYSRNISAQNIPELQNSTIGTYKESAVDETFKYRNINFDFSRKYDSESNSWLFSVNTNLDIDSTHNRITAFLPNLQEVSFIPKDSQTYYNAFNQDEIKVVLNTAQTEVVGYDYRYGNNTYHYNANGVLTSITDDYGYGITLQYSNGTITFSDNPGRSYIVSIDNQGNVLSVTDPNNNSISYTYNLDNMLTSVVDQAGVTLSSYQYTNGVLTKSMDKSISYNLDGTVSQLLYDSGAYSNITYNSNTVSISYSNNKEQQISYDYDGNLQSITSDGVTTEYNYDLNNRLDSVYENNELIKEYEYNEDGDLVYSLENEVETNYYYSLDGLCIKTVSHNGDNTSTKYYDYDIQGRLVLTALLDEEYEGTVPDSYDSQIEYYSIVNNYTNGLLYQTHDYNNEQNTTYIYDTYGNNTRIVCNSTQSNEITAVDSTFDLRSNLLTMTDGDSEVSYIYDEAGRALLVDSDGDCTRTIYDSLGRVIQKISPEDYDSACEGLPLANTYSNSNVGQRYYYQNGLLVEEINRYDIETDYYYSNIGNLTRKSFDIYDYYYNIDGSYDEIKVNGQTVIDYGYDVTDSRITGSNHTVNQIEYANGNTETFDYINDRLYNIYADDNSSSYYEYSYDIAHHKDIYKNKESGYRYYYSENETEVKYKPENELIISMLSYSTSEATGESTVSGTSYGQSYSIASGDQSISNTYGDLSSVYSYTKNSDGDIASDSISLNQSEIISTAYSFDDINSVASKNVSLGSNTMLDLLVQYDNSNSITAIGTNNRSQFYTYDSNNQLVRADNSTGNYSAVYTYDSRGNILSKTVYPYTTGSLENATAQSTKTFVYKTNGWHDELEYVDNTELEYDNIGNVTGYGDREFSWAHGRQLVEITEGTDEYSYSYDVNGIRVSKTVNGSTTFFNTIGGKIMAQRCGNDIIWFQYGLGGAPLGFVYNNTQYFYVTNQLGDVIGITDDEGNLLCTYEYDEWGAVLNINSINSNAQTIAEINPLRYRGYYYDSETGYYYLQSRYYDPSICRFINSDDFSYISTSNPQRLNAFAYCYNNPVNYVDYKGFYGEWGSETVIDIICTLIIFDSVSTDMVTLFGEDFTSKFFEFLGELFETVPATLRLFVDIIKDVPAEVWDVIDTGLNDIDVFSVVSLFVSNFINDILLSATEATIGELMATWAIGFLPAELALILPGILLDDNLTTSQKFTLIIFDSITFITAQFVNFLLNTPDAEPISSVLLNVVCFIAPIIVDVIVRERFKRRHIRNEFI